jgi:hypothetical protein
MPVTGQCTDVSPCQNLPSCHLSDWSSGRHDRQSAAASTRRVTARRRRAQATMSSPSASTFHALHVQVSTAGTPYKRQKTGHEHGDAARMACDLRSTNHGTDLSSEGAPEACEEAIIHSATQFEGLGLRFRQLERGSTSNKMSSAWEHTGSAAYFNTSPLNFARKQMNTYTVGRNDNIHDTVF